MTLIHFDTLSVVLLADEDLWGKVLDSISS
jgi:hypothetical protein